MRVAYSGFLLITLFFLHGTLAAQKKDSLRLTCLLNDAVEAASVKPGVDIGATELKIVLSSPTDTLVKACADVVISNIQRDGDDGTWEVVFSRKNYWFWLSGLTKVYVKKGQRLKTGEVIGNLETGKRIELLLYDFETPLDPKKYMNCGHKQ